MSQFNLSDSIRYGFDEASKVYMGLDLVWFPTPSGVQWGPHEVFSIAGSQWLFFPVLTTGDDLYDAFSMTQMGGSVSTQKFSMSFETEADAIDFVSEVDSFTVEGYTLNPADATQSANTLVWTDLAAVNVLDGASTASGSYVLKQAAVFEPLVVDRTPLYAAFYAATKGNRSLWGSPSSDFTITPAAGASAADLADPAENGKRFYTNQLKDRALGAALDAGSPFNRLVLGNPGGFTAGDPLPGTEDSQGYFAANAGSLMSTASVNSYGVDSDGTTVVSSWPSPYVDSSGAAGDSVTAWSSALDDLRDSGHVSEVFAYVGYGWAYTDDTFTNVDYNVAAYATGWSRSVKEPVVYPTDSLQIEWDILKTAGFDNMSFDAGTRVAKYNDETDFIAGAARISGIRSTVDAPTQQLYEALPRTVDGGKKDPERYAYAKHWLLWPTSSGISTDGTGTTVMGRPNGNGNSVAQLDGWNLDPATTEVHVVIDINEVMYKNWYGNTLNGTGQNGTKFTWPQFKTLVARIKEEGFIPSCQSWDANGATLDDGQGGTVGAADLVKYIATDGAYDPVVVAGGSTTITGTCKEVNPTNFQVDNYADSGLDADRYKYYGSNMLRDTGNQLRILVDMQSNSDSAADWNADYNLVSLELKIDGVAFAHTAFSQNFTGGESLLDFRMVGTTASVDAFLADADGKSFEFTFTVTNK